MTAAHKAESEQEDWPREGVLSEIGSVRGEGQYCKINIIPGVKAKIKTVVRDMTAMGLNVSM